MNLTAKRLHNKCKYLIKIVKQLMKIPKHEIKLEVVKDLRTNIDKMAESYRKLYLRTNLYVHKLRTKEYIAMVNNLDKFITKINKI